MIIYTDDSKYAEKFFYEKLKWQSIYQSETENSLGNIPRRLLLNDTIYKAQVKSKLSWKYIFISEYSHDSQFDILKSLVRNGQSLPDGIICLAGYGKKFHGFHSRQWASLPGNLHMSVYFAPNEKIDNFGAGFLILSAVSALQAIDSYEGLNGLAGIKWVNDILIKNQKVCGVLAHTLAQGKKVTDAILGIGLNVESEPEIEADEFIPGAACMNTFASDNEKYSQYDVFQRLIEKLDNNYKLLSSGKYPELLDVYRQRCGIIGKKAVVKSESLDGNITGTLIEGSIEAIGDNLELFFDGHPEPITSGRLILQD